MNIFVLHPIGTETLILRWLTRLVGRIVNVFRLNLNSRQVRMIVQSKKAIVG